MGERRVKYGNKNMVKFGKMMVKYGLKKYGKMMVRTKYDKITGQCLLKKKVKSESCGKDVQDVVTFSMFFLAFWKSAYFAPNAVGLEALHRFPWGVLAIRWTFVPRTASSSSCCSGGASCMPSGLTG